MMLNYCGCGGRSLRFAEASLITMLCCRLGIRRSLGRSRDLYRAVALVIYFVDVQLLRLWSSLCNLRIAEVSLITMLYCRLGIRRGPFRSSNIAAVELPPRSAEVPLMTLLYCGNIAADLNSGHGDLITKMEEEALCGKSNILKQSAQIPKRRQWK